MKKVYIFLILIVMIFTSGCGNTSTKNDISPKILEDKFEGFWVSDMLDYEKLPEGSRTRNMFNQSFEDITKEIGYNKNIGILIIKKEGDNYIVYLTTDYIVGIRKDWSIDKIMKEKQKCLDETSADDKLKSRTKYNPKAYAKENILKIIDEKVTTVKIGDEPWKDVTVTFDLDYNENNGTLKISNYVEKLGTSFVQEEDTYIGYRFTRAGSFKKYNNDEYRALKNELWDKIINSLKK